MPPQKDRCVAAGPYNHPIMYAKYAALSPTTQAVNTQARQAGTGGAESGQRGCSCNKVDATRRRARQIPGEEAEALGFSIGAIMAAFLPEKRCQEPFVRSILGAVPERGSWHLF